MTDTAKRPNNPLVNAADIADDDGWFDEPIPCPACKGRGTVNPLTAPEGFFCVSTTDCPMCDGTGDCP